MPPFCLECLLIVVFSLCLHQLVLFRVRPFLLGVMVLLCFLFSSSKCICSLDSFHHGFMYGFFILTMLIPYLIVGHKTPNNQMEADLLNIAKPHLIFAINAWVVHVAIILYVCLVHLGGLHKRVNTIDKNPKSPAFVPSIHPRSIYA